MSNLYLYTRIKERSQANQNPKILQIIFKLHQLQFSEANTIHRRHTYFTHSMSYFYRRGSCILCFVLYSSATTGAEAAEVLASAGGVAVDVAAAGSGAASAGVS